MDIQFIKNLLNTWLSFPNNKIYCQVSTINNKVPHIRTMDLYHITDEGHVILLTETSTRKWVDLNHCDNIAICIVHLDHGQIIVEGKAILKTSINDLNTATFYWDNFLDQYWKNFYLTRSNSDTKNIPASFGVIIVKPHLWEILEINQQDFLKSPRIQFQLINKKWNREDILPV